MTVWVVVMVDHGVVDGDGILVFDTEQAAVENFMEVADDIQLIESDTYEQDLASWSAWSKNYSVNIFEKVV